MRIFYLFYFMALLIYLFFSFPRISMYTYIEVGKLNEFLLVENRNRRYVKFSIGVTLTAFLSIARMAIEKYRDIRLVGISPTDRHEGVTLRTRNSVIVFVFLHIFFYINT